MLHMMADRGDSLIEMEKQEAEARMDAENREVQEKVDQAKRQFAQVLGPAWDELEPYIVWGWGPPWNPTGTVNIECDHPDFGKLKLTAQGETLYITSRHTNCKRLDDHDEVAKLLAIARKEHGKRKAKWQELMHKAEQAIEIAAENKMQLEAYKDACRRYCIEMRDAHWYPWKAWRVEYNAGDHTDFVMSLDPPVQPSLRVVKGSGKIVTTHIGQFVTGEEIFFEFPPDIHEAAPYHKAVLVGGYVINLPPMASFQDDNAPQRAKLITTDDRETEDMVRYLVEELADPKIVSPEELLARMGYEKP